MLTLRQQGADIFIPDATDRPDALARTTHLGVGAHQDDLEILAYHGILECFGRADRWFTGVTCTNGGGSSRTGVYADYTDDDMVRVRREEQRTAAAIGRYAAVLQLDYPSAVIKNPAQPAVSEDLYDTLLATRPSVIYSHNPADKHDTHLAVLTALLAALQRMDPSERPDKLYGCEVWRDLDWMPDAHKVVFDVSGRDHLAAALLGVFDSQIAGGKRYDLAAIGRRVAHATYLESHGVDTGNAMIFAVDLTSVMNGTETLESYVGDLLDRFRGDVIEKLSRVKRRDTP